VSGVVCFEKTRDPSPDTQRSVSAKPLRSRLTQVKRAELAAQRAPAFDLRQRVLHAGP
jgi:hypothetical protein